MYQERLKNWREPSALQDLFNHQDTHLLWTHNKELFSFPELSKTGQVVI